MNSTPLQTHTPTSETSSEGNLGFEIPISEINATLSHLWKDQARTRASMMNFAIYEEADDALARNSKILAEITAEHACRGILIAAPPGEPEENAVRAWVTAHCQLKGGKKTVCSEQLAFLINAPNPDLIRNTVFAHLDSDLPLILWWRGDLSEYFEERFYSVIDRLIIDSSTWSNPIAQFGILEAAHRQTSSRFAVNDLAWSRSYHQRLALAALFEDCRLASKIGTLKSITVGHKSGNRVPALMLAAWTITRLGLTHSDSSPPQDAEGLVFKNPHGNPVHLKFEDTGVVGRTAIKSFELSGEDWKVLLIRHTESEFIESHTEVSGQSSESFFPADVRSEAALISKILSVRGLNRLYFEAIPLLQKLLAIPSENGQGDT